MTDNDPTTDGYAVPQASADDLATMKPDAILTARAEGRLDALLGIPPRSGAAATADALADVYKQLTAEDAERMTPEQVVAAKAAGRFDRLLGKPARTTHPTNF